MMKRAIQLAKLAKKTSPNPPVGAILVKNKKIIAIGYHRGPGKPHAEIDALKKVKNNARGAVLYVTLEPCCHLDKRTPPCVNEIVNSGISKVVIGTLDPNSQVNGKGVRLLKKNGIKIEVNCLKEECENLIRAYKKWIVTKIPYVILKSAISLDGKIATKSGDSHWITGEESRKKVHQLRSRVDAILVGGNTALKDNPQLTVRSVKGKSPLRIVIDSHLKLPSTLHLFRNLQKYPTLIVTLLTERKNPKVKLFQNMGIEFIFCRKTSNGFVDLRDLLIQLGKVGVVSLLIEGGGTLNSTLLQNYLFDELWLFIAPIIIGKRGIELFSQVAIQKLRNAYRFQRVYFNSFKKDFLFVLKPIC